MTQIAKAIAAVSLAAIGVAGMYFKVEYSGWVLITGLMLAINL